MNWYEINQLLDQSSNGMHRDGHTPYYRANMRACVCRRRENMRLGFRFNFVDRQSTAKIGSFEISSHTVYKCQASLIPRPSRARGKDLGMRQMSGILGG